LLRVRSAARPKPEVLRELQPKPRAFLSAQERGRIHLIPIGEVIYLKAELKYVTVRDGRREYLVDESLTRLESEYAEFFVRVHRNCLVARHAIRGFERAAGDTGEGNWLVVLQGCEEKIAVSRRQQHIVREIGKDR
jgi:two-component system response regulator AlgR